MKHIVKGKHVYGGMFVDKYFVEFEGYPYPVQVSSQDWVKAVKGHCLDCGQPEKSCTCKTSSSD